MLSTARATALLSLLATAACAPVGKTILAPRQAGAPQWADAATAAIHPGVNTNTAGSCTSNFIFYQGNELYIGQAAHCSSTGEATSTNGCESGTLPEGTPVTITGASVQGTMVYNSWARMQARGETDGPTCQFNDLALVRIDPADHDKVNPSVPVFGGPTGIRTSELGLLEPMYSYGNSVLRQGLKVFSPKYGTHYGTDADWSHNILLQFGIPGDSGSGLFDGQGLAAGVLSTLQFAPVPTSNGFGNFEREFNYLKSFSEFSDVQLALGTEDFAVRLPSLL